MTVQGCSRRRHDMCIGRPGQMEEQVTSLRFRLSRMGMVKRTISFCPPSPYCVLPIDGCPRGRAMIEKVDAPFV